MIMSCSSNLADSVILVLYIFCCSFQNKFKHKIHNVKLITLLMKCILKLFCIPVTRYLYHMLVLFKVILSFSEVRIT